MIRSPFKLIALLLCCLAAGCAVSAQSVTQTYLPDYTPFANPERGWYWSRTGFTNWPQETRRLDADELREWRKQGVTMVRLLFGMEGYQNTPLPQNFRDEIDRNCAIARAEGFKILTQFYYFYYAQSLPGMPADDAPTDQIIAHLAQLKPVFARNADVLFVHNAGFIGQYGEAWGGSHNNIGNDGSTPDPVTGFKDIFLPNANTKRIVAAMLDSYPGWIQIRTPRYVAVLNGDWNPPTPEQAFTGIPRARFGFDQAAAFVDGWSAGAYQPSSDRDRQYNFWKEYSKYTLTTGDSPYVAGSTELVCANGIQMLQDHHMTLLNLGYHPLVFDEFKQQGCFDEIERRLGYRFRLISAQASPTATAGNTYSIAVTGANDGFAPIYNERPTIIVLRSDKDNREYKINATGIDFRRWIHGNQSGTLSMTLPADLPAGQYSVLLSLPDKNPAIAKDPRYSVRLANVNTWETATGYNNLKIKLTVASGASAPPPLPASATTTTSGAHYRAGKHARGGILSTFGQNLALQTAVASTQPLPTTLGGVSLRVVDAAGNVFTPGIWFTSASQINWLLPQEAALGTARLSIVAPNGETLTEETLNVVEAAGGFFTADSTGGGRLTGFVLYVKPDGSCEYNGLARYNATTGKMEPVPVDYSRGKPYLELFGTGWRNFIWMEAYPAGKYATILYAGPQPQYQGLDQINIELPSLPSGDIPFLLKLDGSHIYTTSEAPLIRVK